MNKPGRNVGGSASSDELDESLDDLIGDLTKTRNEKDRKKAEVFGTPIPTQQY
jgi:hypothetical protein